VCVAIIYQLHPSKKYVLKAADLFKEISEFVNTLATSKLILIYIGMAIRMQIPNNWVRFLYLLIRASMRSKKDHTYIITSYIFSSAVMMII